MFFLRQHRLEFIVSFASLAMLGYFSYQGMYGPRSFYYRDQLVHQVAQLNADYKAVNDLRVNLETRVQQMRPESVDADMLDEFARRDLSMGKASDLIVIATH